MKNKNNEFVQCLKKFSIGNENSLTGYLVYAHWISLICGKISIRFTTYNKNIIIPEVIVIRI